MEIRKIKTETEHYMDTQRPLCFIAMPFGKKKNASGHEIDFDSVYEQLIRPAIEDAELDPIRANEEEAGGIIHKPMYERLLLCEYAVADLTTANANVFYELGIRHATRPHSSILVFAEGDRLPFDISFLRGLPYELDPSGKPKENHKFKTELTNRLLAARSPTVDSPIYQLVESFPEVAHTSTDVFRERVAYSQELKQKLANAKGQGLDHLQQVEEQLGNLEDVEYGILVDLLLSYRDVESYEDMVRVETLFPKPLSNSVMIQEQLAFALNRLGERERAESVLRQLLKSRGPSSETLGLLGRVYKDRWEQAIKQNQHALAKGLLKKAVDTYLKGFEADWRDAYPGVNAVTLMELSEPPDPRTKRVLPVVEYAVRRKISDSAPDYWDHATLLELAVLGEKQSDAEEALGDAFAEEPEGWMRKTTARNLRLIRTVREKRGKNISWIQEIEAELLNGIHPE